MPALISYTSGISAEEKLVLAPVNHLATAHLSGIHPRSPKLIAARMAYRWNKKYNGKKLSKNDIRRLHREDSQTLVQLQREAGLSEVIDGLLNWNSILEPTAECMSGIEVPSTNIRRWFNTNTFYHKPVIFEKIRCKRTLPQEFFLTKENGWKAILPGPFTFTSLADNRIYKDPSELMLDLAHAENRLIARLEDLGCEHIQLDEPSLVYRPFMPPITKDEQRAIVQAEKTTLKGRNVKSTIMTYFEDANPVMKILAEMPNGKIGIDLTETSITSMKEFPTDKQLAAGCIDSRNPVIEDAKWLNQTVLKIRKHMQRNDLQISICPNTGLRYLPRPIADEKLRSMGKAAKLIGDD